MKILYDYQIFAGQKFGGISRYFFELMNHSEGLFDFKLSGVYSENEYIKSLGVYKKFPLVCSFKGRQRIINYINKIDSVKKTRNEKYDILHPTYYDPYVIKHRKKPLVLTVYDMIHETFPDYFRNDKLTVARKKVMMLDADGIIAISKSTKNDILKYYPEISADKIRIIHLATSLNKIEHNGKKETYILFAGQRGAYKNFNMFVDAIAPILKKYDLRLICTGLNFNKQEIELFEKLKIVDRVSVQFVNDTELTELYSRATLFVFPSLYEGFGIPVLEAFATGCPAVLANTSSLPEIGGEAALYFDPHSVEDMRLVIERAVNSPDLLDQLAERGREQLKKYSWERCAVETAKIYQAVQA